MLNDDILLNKKAIHKFLESIDLNKKILEIGPLQTPLFRKNQANIYYADIRDTDSIKERFKGDDKVNNNEVIPIDFVIKESYKKTLGDIKFDYIISNNVLEHIPNPISFLLDLSEVLNEKGKVGFLIPDKNYSIDFYRENSSFVDLFDMYYKGEHRNTPRQALDFYLNHVNENNPRKFWANEKISYPNPDFIEVFNYYNKFNENDIFDEHYWAFTDVSFLRIIENLIKFKLIPFKVHKFFPTAYNDNVFGIILELNYNIQNNQDLIVNEVNKIHEFIDYINQKHFEIKAADIIRENTKLKNEIAILKGLNNDCTLEEFFQKNPNLKKSFKGEDDYLFLYNDGNFEIRQHFDKDFNHYFNMETFTENFLKKKKIFENNGIDSYFFIVPDKSVVCKDYLPFKIDYFERNYNKVSHLFPDFVNELNPQDYFKHDTHMKVGGGIKLAYKFLNYINPKFNINEFKEMMDKFNFRELPLFDLFNEQNWSYSIEEKRRYDSSKYSEIKHENLKDMKEHIPNQFKSSHERESSYFINNNFVDNRRVLIFHDSSIESLKYFLIPYFNEIFFYWDHLTLNKDVIKWYNPDIIIEVRIERFLEYYSFPKWIENNDFN